MSIYIFERRKKKVERDEDAAAVLVGEDGDLNRVFFFFFFSANPSFVNESLSGYVAGSQVTGQGSVGYGEDALALPPMVGENTVSPALLLCSLSSACRRDFNQKENERGEPSTLSLLSLQRYKTSFFLACCKNRAFF